MRCSKVNAVASALLMATVFGTATHASAAEYADGVTSGSTVLGVRGELMVRRPGVPSGQFYDLKLRADIKGTTDYYYVGYRAQSTGAVEFIRQAKSSAGTTTASMGSTSVASKNYVAVSHRQYLNDAIEVVTPAATYKGPGGPTYDALAARTYMTDGSVGLDSTKARFLSYYTTYTGATAAWGSQNTVNRTTVNICAYFFNNTEFNFAHNYQSC